MIPSSWNVGVVLLGCCRLLLAQPCMISDFGIAYRGTTVFSVSSTNQTCSCTNYHSEGLAAFRTAAISSLAATDIFGTRLVINGTSDFEGRVEFNDAVSFADGATLSVGSVLDLGAGAVGRQPDAGKLGYGAFGFAESLNIVGAGTAVGNRKVSSRRRHGQMSFLQKVQKPQSANVGLL
eukprot:TRINITY_DN9325_c0_g1_i2.p1 TRINITY_DN9325_c0_g1~~TRINITY_DN9325_c0_g1_i2.p1  ORF type:complete len:179 (+),score=46.39 TRINITY_DN9325_c0_g1_i2:804-1340(+)